MQTTILPPPDAKVIGRRDAIVRDLERLLGAGRVIADEDGRRAFETDGLTAYRCMPLAVVLPRTTDEVSRDAEVRPRQRHQGHSARRRHVAVRRRAAGGGRDRRRRLAHEPGARGRHREPLRAGRDRDHQSRHLRGGAAARLLLRARSVEPARLHARRQHRDELGRRPLPQVWRHDQQRARPQDGARRRPRRRDRRQLSRHVRATICSA